MNKISINCLVILSWLIMVPSLRAQETATDAATVIYEKEFFEKYSPVTLLDMLQRIPGVQEIINKNREQNQQRTRPGAQAQGERGFGSGGDQILIDGKRLAGKTNNIDDTLSRISAEQVARVELIRGATSGLDVQSQGLVINVLMIEGASTSTTFWKLSGKYSNKRNKFPPELLVSHSGAAGNFQYMFSGELKNNHSFYDREELHFNAGDIETGEKEIFNKNIDQAIVLNTNLSYSFADGSELRLNGMFENSTRDRNEDQNEIGLQPLHTIWITDQDFDKWEIGGDYGRDLGLFGRFKALFVINSNKEDTKIIRDRDIDTDPFQYADEFTTLDKSEKIIRASITKGIGQSQSIELGGETAINTFNKQFSDSRRTDSNDPFVLGASDNVKIKENRYEVFANHTFNFSSALVLQSSLTAEFSKIVADSIETSTRRDTSFTYLKPRINMRYDFTGTDQLRLTAEKKVSQLDFNNFVTSYDSRVEQLLFGNTNIRPEQVWEFSAAFEHRLPNDGGSLEAEIFYRDYTDHITKIDFTEYQDALGNRIGVEDFFALNPDDALRDMINFTSKSGNIDGATAKGVRLKGNVRLGFINLPQAVIGLGYVYEKRRYTDTFTLDSRNFSRASDHIFSFNFRHDVTDWDFSYGFDGRLRSTQDTVDRTFIWPRGSGMNFNVFVEKSIFKGTKLRIEARQFDQGTGTSTLSFYSDHRRFNDLIERSEKIHRRAQEVMISLQGTF